MVKSSFSESEELMDFRDPALIPLPASDDEFERLCLLVARDRYGPEFYRYGRHGQKQYGIDIYSAYYDGKCLQCKLHRKETSDKVLIRELGKDLQEAKQKFRGLREFIFAVSVETRPPIQDACTALSDSIVRVIPWFWDQLQQQIAHSKWLLRYYLSYAQGAQWISTDFIKQETDKGNLAGWTPKHFYSGNSLAQWYGLIQQWDAPRRDSTRICSAIAYSFQDSFGDMPIAAVIRGHGGGGKSVLLRRIALTLMNDYTVYWISDNGTDFLENEWAYDVDVNPHERYLIIFDDWYRNFARIEDKYTANRILQRVRSKPNVRLLIGDRPAQTTYYPFVSQLVFDLDIGENRDLLPFIVELVPEWQAMYYGGSAGQLLRTGLFQILFVYRNTELTQLPAGLTNYFVEIIQSDYDRLRNNHGPFYAGVARAIYVYAHLYTDFSLRLTLDGLIRLAEAYSSTPRPIGLEHNQLALFKVTAVGRYLDLGEPSNAQLRFLHDTLADEGWMRLRVGAEVQFDATSSIAEVAEALKTEETSKDLASLVYMALKLTRKSFTQKQIFAYCEYLVSCRCESFHCSGILFEEGLAGLPVSVRIEYLERLLGLANEKEGFWFPIVKWISSNLVEAEQRQFVRRLVEGGNRCGCVLAEYTALASEIELGSFAGSFITLERLCDPTTHGVVTPLLRKLSQREDLHKAMSAYLMSEEPERNYSNFTACLQFMKNEEVAQVVAANYLNADRIGKNTFIVTTCLNILGAKAAGFALNYLNSKGVVKDEYIRAACLNALGAGAASFASDILRSPIDGQKHQIIYRALQIASKVEELDAVAADMVERIFGPKPRSFDAASGRSHHLYLQCMKVPLFRINIWRTEVEEILLAYKRMNRNLFYSLSLSHTSCPEKLVDHALYFIRNWKGEFARPKKHWAYFVRCLAHPIISEQFSMRQEVAALCRNMLSADGCPKAVRHWCISITDKDEYPQWDFDVDGDL